MASVRQPLKRVLRESQRSFYVCRKCKTQLQKSNFAVSSRDYTSKPDLPFTEKIRRKIWGTDNPPGLADPYGGPSFLEKRRMRREAAQQQANGIAEPEQQRKSFGETDLESVQALELDGEAQEYIEARTWDGLQHIGHLGDWRDLPPEPQDEYYSWFNATNQVAIERRELLSCLHQAIVECLACEEASIDPATVLLFDPVEIGSEVYASTNILPVENGLQLQFASNAEKDQLIGLLRAVGDALAESSAQDPVHEAEAAQAEAASSTEEMTDAEFDEHIPGEDEFEAAGHISPALEIQVSHYDVLDEAFLNARLELQNPLTFTILKRFAQLSGQRTPDHLLGGVVTGKKSLGDLLDSIHNAVKPKPKNVAAVLLQKQALTGQGNVWVMPRRHTPVDKEKEIGRWKIIERELQDRGLPVLGKLQS